MVNIVYAHKRHPVEPLGIGYMSSAVARGGHRSKMVLTSPKRMEAAVEQTLRAIDENQADILAQSIIFGSHGYAADLSRRVQQARPKVISVLGGPAATFTPELIDRGFDVICRYEGEASFLEFCNALQNGGDVGNIPNIWVKENPALYRTKVKRVKTITDVNDPRYKDESGFDQGRRRFVNATRRLLEGDALNEVPHPDRIILYEHDLYGQGPIKHFMHTRGCAFRCAYCFNVVQNMEMKGKGKSVRFRIHQDVVDEINEVRQAGFPIELVYFQDDVFGPAYTVVHARDFAEVYKREVGLPFHAHVRFDLIKPEVADALADAGCTGVHAAIEAGNDDIRNRVHRRDMSTRQVIGGATELRRNGIRMMTQNILGAPGETWAQMMETLELNILVKPTFASASIFQPYPGTAALEFARDHGSLPTKDLNDLIDTFGNSTFYNGSILIMDPEEKKRLEVFQSFFAIAVENPELYRSGELERMMLPHIQNGGSNAELREMYRKHRDRLDEVLYGVKFRDVVTADEE